MEKQNMLQCAEIQLTYRPVIKAQHRPKVETGRQAYELLLSSWDKGNIEFIEQFKLMLLSRSNKVLGIYTVSTGGMAGCFVDVKLVFASALLSCAHNVILAHNHPSGNLRPSELDLSMTRRIKEAGRVLDIQVLDHIIITTDSYYSFADEGIL